MVFHHDNARLHFSIDTQQKVRELGWGVLMHPHSLDLAPSDLFRLLQNSLGSVKLTSKEHCEHYLSDFLNQKYQNFFIIIFISRFLSILYYVGRSYQ